MSILLVRHAKAEFEHRLGDGARALTRKGRAKFRAHSRDLARRTNVRRIGTSPLVRAVQTAEILAGALGVTDVTVMPELAPGPLAARRIVELVLELRSGWALVGHNPSLTEAAATLLRFRKLPVSLKKGSALAIAPRKSGACDFEWLAAPGERWVTQ